MNPLFVIPARMASQRLPGKPLADIHSMPMIVHVWRRAVEADAGPVVVACAEPEIAEAITAAGGKAVLTRPDHPSGSDRVFEAVTIADPDAKHEIIVNIQGDLPTLDPAQVRAVLTPFESGDWTMTTPVTAIISPEEVLSFQVVKAVASFVDNASVGRALYFSRNVVPSGEGPLWHHIGMYGYRREALATFVSMPPTPLEKRERLEQLRALEHGMSIAAVRVPGPAPFGVDTPADLERAREILKP